MQREDFLQTLYSQSRLYGVDMRDEIAASLADYYQLLENWNPRLHLVAPCSPAEFATRHVLESLYLLKHLPERSSVIDVGSGGGLPIIPCLIARPDLQATLIESSKKKSVFLREALLKFATESSRKFAGQEGGKRSGTLAQPRLPLTVLAARFEDVSGLNAEFVTCRALDRFENKLQHLIEWSPAKTLLLYGGHSLRTKLAELDVEVGDELLPNSDQRFLFSVRRR